MYVEHNVLVRQLLGDPPLLLFLLVAVKQVQDLVKFFPFIKERNQVYLTSIDAALDVLVITLYAFKLTNFLVLAIQLPS
jgi:hypothetical protein